MTQHTPTPWFRDGDMIRAETKDDGIVTVATVRGWTKEYEKEEKANAAFIVKAVNCHADFVSIAKRCLEYFEPSMHTVFADHIKNVIAKAEGK